MLHWAEERVTSRAAQAALDAKETSKKVAKDTLANQTLGAKQSRKDAKKREARKKRLAAAKEFNDDDVEQFDNVLFGNEVGVHYTLGSTAGL